MFWRYVNPNGSNFEALLMRDPPPTLEDLLDDTDLLTECKTQNAKLMEVLGRPDMVRGLFQWVTRGLEPRSGTDDTDMERTRRQRCVLPCSCSRLLLACRPVARVSRLDIFC